jgi:UDP-3-O-[3-hydroxymyristoyl] N-acetylglucosamine deacetylase
LDAIGDMKLAGAPLLARYEGRRSSHTLNYALLRALFSDEGNYERVTSSES